MTHHAHQVMRKLDNGQVHIETRNDEPTMTQQQFKDECDINNIVKKFNTTGQFTHLTSRTGQYADFSLITDYQDMLQTVQYAQEAFGSLPAEVRAQFRNDPGNLLQFIQDEKNYEKAQELGLLDAEKVKAKAAKRENASNAKTRSAAQATTPPTDPGAQAHEKGSKGS